MKHKIYLFMSRTSDVMYELVDIKGQVVYLTNNHVDAKFIVVPGKNPWEVMCANYELVGEI